MWTNEYGALNGMILIEKNRSTRRKTCPSTTFCTIRLFWQKYSCCYASHEGRGAGAKLHSFLATSLDMLGCQLHARQLWPGERTPLYPMNRSIGGPQSQCENFGKQTHFLPPTGTKPWCLASVVIVVRFCRQYHSTNASYSFIHLSATLHNSGTWRSSTLKKWNSLQIYLRSSLVFVDLNLI
jgi:hypothetical protein